MTDKPTIQQRAAPLLAILSAKKPQGLLPETRDIMALLREALAEIERLTIPDADCRTIYMALHASQTRDLSPLLRAAWDRGQELACEARDAALSNVQKMHDPAIEILSESRQQVGGVSVNFRVGRIK